MELTMDCEWEPEALQIFWAALAYCKGTTGDALSLSFRPDAVILDVAIGGVLGSLTFPANCSSQEHIDCTVPLAPFLRNRSRVWSSALPWRLSVSGSRGHVHLFRDGKSIQIPLLHCNHYLSVAEKSQGMEPLWPTLQVPGRFFAKELRGLLSGFRTSSVPAVEGLLAEVFLQDQYGVWHRKAVPELQIRRSCLLLLLTSNDKVERVFLDAEWLQVGGLEVLRQIPIADARRLLGFWSAVLGKKGDGTLRVSWRGDRLRWSGTVSGVEMVLETKYLPQKYLDRHEELVPDKEAGDSLTLAKRDFKRRVELSRAPYVGADSPRPGECSGYEDSIMLDDRGGKLQLASGALLLRDQGRRARKCLVERTSVERSRQVVAMVSSTQALLDKESDIDWERVFGSGGVQAQLPVQERSGGHRFRRVIFSAKVGTKLGTWAAGKYMGLQVCWSKVDSMPARMVFRDAKLSEPVAGKSRRARSGKSSGVTREAVMLTKKVPAFLSPSEDQDKEKD